MITKDQYNYLMTVRAQLRNCGDTYLAALGDTLSDRQLLQLARLLKD